MKKMIVITFKILLVTIVTIWLGLILIEYRRFQDGEPMLVLLKEEVKRYDDGNVYINWGLGYKSIVYDRGATINGKEFGHLFIKERTSLPERN